MSAAWRASEQESVGGTALLLWMECVVQCIAGMESGAVPRGITPFRREGGRATKGEGAGEWKAGRTAPPLPSAPSSSVKRASSDSYERERGKQSPHNHGPKTDSQVLRPLMS